MKKPGFAGAIVLAGLAGVCLWGCGTKTEVSPQEQANFKGGPPPAGFEAEAAKRKAAAEQRTPANFKAWLEQRKSAMATKGASAGPPPAAASKSAPQ